MTVKLFDPSRRRLLHALVVSLALHALILLGVVSEPRRRLDLPATVIKVVFSAAETAATVIAPDSKSPAVPLLRRPPAVPGTHPRQFVVAQSPVVAPAPPSAGIVAAAPPVEAVVPPETVDRPSRAIDMQTSAASAAPTLSPEGVNANDLRQYRLSLAIAARRFKRYPAMARERGWEGTADVVLTVGAQRSAPDVSLVRSSGYAELDRQAQEMMAQAARATVLPESLRGRDLRVSLPVQFSLDASQ